ncbi:hypothetical protein L1049_021399 [Liquidambar formosana]|uniref:TFIIS N-terminal domain-containing protein n=1 Tax=Liquidambar formosana TaxID=63359 RepID=A0AAP0N8C9_LIQFO
MDPDAKDYWRNKFQKVDADIFKIIENGIIVAASDRPKEFRARRDQIAELLFTWRPEKIGEKEVDIKFSVDGSNGETDGAGISKESKVSTTTNDRDKTNHSEVSLYSFDEARALTEEIEKEDKLYQDVMKIKRTLSNSQEEPAEILLELLRRLQTMAIPVQTLKVTNIGQTVDHLRKHESRKICQLARTLVQTFLQLLESICYVRGRTSYSSFR